MCSEQDTGEEQGSKAVRLLIGCQGWSEWDHHWAGRDFPSLFFKAGDKLPM